MESNTSINLNVNTTLEAELHIDKSQAQTELEKLFDTIQQKLKETTTREIGEYATAAGKAISDSWDSAKQTVTDTGGEAISDTLSAIFSYLIRSTISGRSLAGAGAPGRAFQMGSPPLIMARLGTSPLAAR